MHIEVFRRLKFKFEAAHHARHIPTVITRESG
jgi:hypothetical protein